MLQKMLALSFLGGILVVGCNTEPYPIGGQTSQNPGCVGSSCGQGNQQGGQDCDVPPSASGVQLQVPYIQQECDELCWDATIDMVGQYFGRVYQECQIASYLVQLQTGNQYNCCYYGACFDQYCNKPASVGEMVAVMKSGFGFHVDLLNRPLTETELQKEITNKRPVIIGFQGPFSGHVAVVVGYEPGNPTMYTVYDPWPNFGAFAATYQDLRNGPQSPWMSTFYGLSPNSGSHCTG